MTRTVLYGIFYPPENALVLSPIPPAFWQHALKIIIHTYHQPGSLAAAAGAIAECGLDTISSWASTESFAGHLCSTSIVVPTDTESSRPPCDQLAARLRKALAGNLSDLPTFGDGKLEAVRVTELSILQSYALELEKNYGADLGHHRVEVSQHSLRLGKSRPVDRGNPSTLWEQLLVASGTAAISACILTPDTEEAFLRVCAIPESARLARIVFRVGIKADGSSFAGYWQEALKSLKDHKHSVFVAHNILVSKQEDPRAEQTEFYFITDRRLSADTTTPRKELRNVLEARFTTRLKALAMERASSVTVSDLRVTRPRGVGVPCFFASNAKPGDGLDAKTAETLCRTLESFGFKPVNVDFALGESPLVDQVKELVKACRFMVVLHCPEDRLMNNVTGDYNPSDWVLFEEASMEAQGGQIFRFRFAQVRRPVFTEGHHELTIRDGGLTQSDVEDFAERLRRWDTSMIEWRTDNVFGKDIADRHLERDLVAYYRRRPSERE